MNETNTTKPQEPATPRRPVYLTGFGKFCTIVENPTTFLVQQLASDENVTEARVLEVSAEGWSLPPSSSSSPLLNNCARGINAIFTRLSGGSGSPAYFGGGEWAPQ